MKRRFHMALAFAMACMLCTAGVGYGEGGSIPTYEVIPQKIHDASYIMEHGLDGVQFEMVSSEDGVSQRGRKDGYGLSVRPEKGYFYCDRPKTYPHHVGMTGELDEWDEAWFTAEEKRQLTDAPGRYTPEEAAEMGLQFLRDAIGMDTSCLYVREIELGEPYKERSCVYCIHYAYRVSDMRVGWWPTTEPGLDISAWITDNGVESMNGYAVSFAPCGEVARADILAQEAIGELAQSSTPPELMYLPLKQREGDTVKTVLTPVWGANLDGSRQRGYNAQTGEMILDFWDLTP